MIRVDSTEGTGTIDKAPTSLALVRKPFLLEASTGVRSELQEAFDCTQPNQQATGVPEDTQLFLAWRQGDQDALTQLEHLYAEQALNVAFRYLRDRQKAEDAVQVAWMRILDCETFDGEKKFGPYFIRTVANVCLDILRKEKRRRVREFSLNDTGAFDRAPINNLEDTHGESTPTEFEEAAQDILAGMPGKYRKVVELKSEGYSTAEIARKVRREEATVRWRLGVAQNNARQAAKHLGFHLRN